MDHCAVRIFCVFSRPVPPTKDEVFPTVTAAVVLWNTVYLERAAHALRGNGHAVDDALLQYLSPLSWEHINLTGDLPLAQQRQDRLRQVQAATTVATGLVCFIFRFLKRPQ